MCTPRVALHQWRTILLAMWSVPDCGERLMLSLECVITGKSGFNCVCANNFQDGLCSIPIQMVRTTLLRLIADRCSEAFSIFRTLTGIHERRHSRVNSADPADFFRSKPLDTNVFHRQRCQVGPNCLSRSLEGNQFLDARAGGIWLASVQSVGW